MATLLNSLKPIIFTINETSLLECQGEGVVNPEHFLVAANQYYYYTVTIGEDYDILFVGKTWGYENTNGETEVKIHVEDIVKSMTYKSWHSLQPIYNENTQELDLFYLYQGDVVTPIDNIGQYRTTGFGRAKVQVYIFNTADLISYPNLRICRMGKYITSSWNINSPVYVESEPNAWQNLLDLEYRNFVSHYPKILTDNFSISYLLNIGNNFSYGINPYYRFGNDDTTYYEIGSQINMEKQDVSGYVPFNIQLSEIVPIIQDESTDAEVYQEINSIPNAKTVAAENEFDCGDASEYTPDNIWVCGDSTPTKEVVPSVNIYNNLYMWYGDNKIKIGEFDQCTKPYYLKWMTKSCVPVCYGFDGNTIASSDYNTTYMKDVYRNNLLKINDIDYKFELKSGILTKQIYKVMEDIFTSPYIILYSVGEDKSYFVKVDDTTYTGKNSVFDDGRPYTFTVNLSKIEETKLLY